MYKAILFDIENTLLYPEVSLDEQLAALELDGAPLFTAASAREAVRQAELWTAEQILREQETNTRMEDDAFFENVLYAYVRNASKQNEKAAGVIRHAILAARGTQNDMPKALHKPDGLPALLEALSARYTLGIVSNHRGRIRRVLDAEGFTPYFKAVMISESAGVEKPDPRILTMTCEALGVEPVESLYVGDHPFDVLCAARAGMDCAWVDNGVFRPEDLPEKPRWPLRAVTALTPVLCAQNAGKDS